MEVATQCCEGRGYAVPFLVCRTEVEGRDRECHPEQYLPRSSWNRARWEIQRRCLID